MTFQIVLRGADGIILASDKQTGFSDVATTVNGQHYSLRWLALGSKVQISRTQNVLIGMSGSAIAAIAADMLLEKIDSAGYTLPSTSVDFLDMLREVTNQAAAVYFGVSIDSQPMSLNRSGGVLLVIAPEMPEYQIYRVDVSQRPYVHRLDAKAYAGD